MRAGRRTITVGIDTGGTFTDLTAVDGDGRIVATTKVPTTPADRSIGILAAIEACLAQLGLGPGQVEAVMHGTTTATNALLERRGARTALLVTRGFRDVLLIARQNRPSLYDPLARRPDPVVPRELSIEVAERVLQDGSVEAEVTDREIERVARVLRRARVDAVAIAFLHSYANAANEERMAAGLARLLPRLHVTSSAELLPRIGEYERASTASVNGFVGPVIERYLDRLTSRLGAAGISAPVYVMQSNGGLASVEAIRHRAVQTILSGPAGGVVAGRAAGRVRSRPHLMTVDMGGTSFDIALLPGGSIELGQGSDVDGIPVSVPAIAIHTLGAGGGSIAWIDPGGALRVGPRSAGAVPGPAGYGLGGDEPTVTDANLVLGRLAPRLLGGALRLEPDLARRAIEKRIAEPLGLTVVEAAHGILRVVNAEMARGVRLMSIARGYDPRDVALIAFGGAGPLHAAELAELVGIDEVVIPPAPGATSSRGVASAELRRDVGRPILQELGSLSASDIRSAVEALRREATAFLVTEGVPVRRVRTSAAARLSYRGQATDLEVAVPGVRLDPLRELARRFASEHRRRYGYVRDDPIRLVSLHVSAVARPVGPSPRRQAATGALEGRRPDAGRPIGRRSAWFGAQPLECAVHWREDLRPGDELVGPAIVEQLDFDHPDPTRQPGGRCPGRVTDAAAGGNLMTRRSLDPIGVQVLQYALGSITDEMHTTLVRTSRSTNIKDREDTSSALFTADGRVYAQSEYATPVHLGTNAHLVPHILTGFDLSSLADGDGLVTNLPYPIGPGHLNDIALISPIHRAGRLIGIAANQAHHVDVGGFAPGSMPFGVSEIYQEGLQIPPVRLFRKHRMDEELWAVIRANVRAPDEVRGDFEAQMTANALGARRLNELIDREGEAAVLGGAEDLFEYAERRARAVIAAIPDGVYACADVLEGDGLTEQPITIAVTLTVAGDEMTFDFSDSADAVDGPLNCRLASVGACCYYVLKLLGGADLPANAGAYRPLRIVLREGSIFDPTYPRAVCNANILTTQRIVDVVTGALAQALPARIGAASSGTMNLVNIGTRTREGSAFTNLVETYAGGQGGHPGQDGMDGVQTHMTNTKNAPVEVLERTYPLRVLGYGLREGTGGSGRWRGGCGVWRRYRLESAGAMVTLSSDRAINRPWGLWGGGPGAPSRCRVWEDGRLRRIPSKASFRIRRGAELLIETPGGGGWGEPSERDATATERDRRAGLTR